MLSDRLGHDVSGYDLDGPLPELPASEQLQSRAKLLTDAARRDNLTLRQLAQMVATGRGHYVMCGTPEQIADRMEQWFREGGADGFNVMPPYFPGGLDDFAHGRPPDPAKARPVPHRIRRRNAARPFRLCAAAAASTPLAPTAYGREIRYIVSRQHQDTSWLPVSSSFRLRMPKSPRSPARWRPRASSWWCRAPIAGRARCRAMATAEYLVCYPNVAVQRRVLQGRAEAQALSAAQRRLRRRRPRGGAARQGAGLQQRRRQRHLGVRARHDADARRCRAG